MTLISIRLPEKVLNEADKHAKTMHVHRAEYICKAIEYWNKETHRHRPQMIKRHVLRSCLRKDDAMQNTGIELSPSDTE